MNLQYQNS